LGNGKEDDLRESQNSTNRFVIILVYHPLVRG